MIGAGGRGSPILSAIVSAVVSTNLFELRQARAAADDDVVVSVAYARCFVYVAKEENKTKKPLFVVLRGSKFAVASPRL